MTTKKKTTKETITKADVGKLEDVLDPEGDRPTPPPESPKEPDIEGDLRARLAAADQAVGECLRLIDHLNETAAEIALAADKVNVQKDEISQRRALIEVERQRLINQINTLRPQ